MKIDVLATEPHFVDHLAPVWHQLPVESRGEFYTGAIPLSGATARARVQGIPEARGGTPVGQGIVMVAASGDLMRAGATAGDARFAFFEHGCGISYNVPQPSYVGSPHRPNVDLFIMPNPSAAAKQRAVHPNRRIEVIGSSPRLDRWVGVGSKTKPGEPPTVAVSFHWDCHVAPETRTALYYYRHHLPDLLGRGWKVIGHGHPRIMDQARIIYRQAGLEIVDEFEEVLERADLYMVDNSSTLYEFASTGRPVVALNCPRYRRAVHHGIRFWDWVPGLQCDQAQDIAVVAAEALRDPPEAVELRRAAMEALYPLNDGLSAVRAAQLVLELAEATEANYPPAERFGRPRSAHVVRDSTGAVAGRFAVSSEARRFAQKRGPGFTVAEEADSGPG